MKIFVRLRDIKLVVPAVLSTVSQFILANPNMQINNQITKQVGRTVSQGVNKNISDRLIMQAKTATSLASRKKLYARPQIKELQQLLIATGFKPGVADGLMGRKTSEAIRNFQKNKRLKVNGLVTEGLLQALRESR